jgi:hypothetical protein
MGVMAFSATALAQEGDTKSKFYNFDDMLIDGQLKTPDMLKTQAREKAKFKRLLSLKKSFLPKIRETAEEQALQ